MKKKVMCLAAAFFFLLSILEAVPVYAALDEVAALPIFYENRASMCLDKSILDSYEIPECVSDYAFYCIFYYASDSGKEYPIIYYSDVEPIFLKYSNGCLRYRWNIDVNYCYWSGSSWVYEVTTSSNGYDLGSVDEDGIFEVGSLSGVYAFVDSNYTLSLGGYNFFNAVEEQYNYSLGYLQDLTSTNLYLEDDNFSLVNETLQKKWSFSNLTTSGLDITTGEYSIRHYQQIQIWDSGYDGDELYKEYDMVFMSEYPAADLSFSYMEYAYKEQLQDASGFEGLSFWDSCLSRYIKTVNYFQLIRTTSEGIEYGGYVRVGLGDPELLSGAFYYATTIDQDGNVDTDGYSDSHVPDGVGSGQSYEEADKNANQSLEDSKEANAFSDSVNDLISQIGAVPEIIGALFSFLPDWVLTSVGIGFALLVFLLIKGAVT